MNAMQSLFKPFKIGKIEIANRIVMAPMVTHFANDIGMLSERHINYYAARAKGGVGLIITESNYVSPDGRGGVHRLGFYGDKMVEGHKKLVDAIHKYDTKIFAQLHHGGSTITDTAIAQIPVSSSAKPLLSKGEHYLGVIPRKLKKGEIAFLIDCFGNAARRAKSAGFDGIQINAGHGYLIHQFLSPLFNEREDEYGGSEERRMRFLLEILQDIRSKVGCDFPVSVRLTGKEFVEGGYSIDFIIKLVKKLEQAGVDELAMTAGNYYEREYMVQPMGMLDGCLVNISAAVIKEANIPVGIVGKIKDPIYADKIITDNKANHVYMGRALIADPELLKKAKEGLLGDIRPCISCMRGCIDRLFKGLDIQCTVNPEVGREVERVLLKAGTRKKVLVVGGGPAGLTASATAAKRGHIVELWEKKSYIGGQLLVASTPPTKEEITPFLDYLCRDAEKSGVKIETGKEATTDLIEKAQPDVIVIATGAKSVRPSIPGSKLNNVVFAIDVLSGNVVVGTKVAIIGGGLVGLETAEFLADKGHDVTVLEMLSVVAPDEEATIKKLLLLRLNDKGVKILINTEAEALTGRGALVKRLGIFETIEAETIILAVGFHSNRDLLSHLDFSRNEIYVIGDANKCARIMDAVQQGAKIGNTI